MHRCFVLLLLFVVGSAFGADGTVSFPIAPTPLAISTPTTWTAERNQVGTVLIVRSPVPSDRSGDQAERERGVVSVAVQTVKNEGPLAFSVRCRRDLERTVMGLVLEKSEDLVLGGRSWTKQAYTMQVGQFTFRQELFTTVIDGQGVCLTCSSEALSFSRWQNEFAIITNSLGRSRLQLDGRP
jgi:hypothetical protein